MEKQEFIERVNNYFKNLEKYIEKRKSNINNT